jgi:hypothetical protein
LIVPLVAVVVIAIPHVRVSPIPAEVRRRWGWRTIGGHPKIVPSAPPL